MDAQGLEKRDRVPVSIDFYGNDIFNMSDNCIEADGGAHNIRVFDNRCFNSIGGALSATPLVGGPVYFFRNLVYNTTSDGVMKVSTAANVLLYQNTFIGDVQMNAANQYVANNVILGIKPAAPTLRVTSYSNYAHSDHNALGFEGKRGAVYEWNTPPFDVGSDWKSPVTKRAFKTLPDVVNGTRQEQHSVAVSFADLARVSAPDNASIQHLYAPEDYDFQPARGSRLIDAGVVLPTINDGYRGKAPDIGAFESGSPLRTFGPRTPVPGTPVGDQSIRSLAGPAR